MEAVREVNSLLLFPAEELSGGRFELRGHRAQYAFERHELAPGLELSVIVYGSRRGKGLIVSSGPELVEIDARLDAPPPPRSETRLIAAVPRPQTVKKILQLACLAGIRSVSFLASENGVKSYLQSKSLEADAILSEIVMGLEQANDPIPPEVAIHRYAPRFFRETLAQRPEGALGLVADQRAGSRGLEHYRLERADAPVYLAIGPEAGWSESELGSFVKLGFEAVSLGPRLLRVETAASFLTAQVELLRGQAGKSA